MSERILNLSLPLGRNLDLKNTNILSEVLKIHSVYFQHRITSGLITSKDNLRSSPGLITSKENLQDCFTSEPPTSFARILCSNNLSHRLCQNSLFREISIWITYQSFTAPFSTVLGAMQDSFLLNKEITPDLILKQHPKVLFLPMVLPNINPHNLPG